MIRVARNRFDDPRGKLLSRPTHSVNYAGPLPGLAPRLRDEGLWPV